MTPTQITKAAIQCANNYLKITEEKGSNYFELKVQDIMHIEDNTFALKLNAVAKGVESTLLKVVSGDIDDKFFSDRIKGFVKNEYFRIIEQDDEEHILKIEIKDDFLPYFSVLKPNNVGIVSDLTFLIKNVVEWYALYGKSIKRPQQNEVPTESVFFSGNESEKQKTAVSTALNNKVSYIWGAPGTGKTQVVLADCIITYIKQKKHVLVLAPTNLAIEQTLRAVIKTMQEQNIEYDCISRLGIPTKNFLKEYPKACVLTEKTKRIKELNKKIQAVNSELLLFEKYNELVHYISLYDKITLCMEKLSNDIEAEQHEKEVMLNELSIQEDKLNSYKEKENVLKISLAKKRIIADSLSLKIASLKKKEASLLYKIKSKFVTVETSAEYEEQRAELQSEISNIEVEYSLVHSQYCHLVNSIEDDKKKIDLIEEKNKKERSILSKCIDKLQTTEEKIYSICVTHFKNECTDVEIIRKYSYDISNEYSEERRLELSAEEKCYKALLQEIQTENKQALVTACTVDYLLAHYDSSETQLKDYPISHIFLDEAAYVPLVKAGVMFAFKAPITMLGDHMQLPPICVAEEEALKDIDTLLFMWSQSALFFSELLSEKYTLERAYNVWANNEVPYSYAVKTAFLTDTYRFGDNLAKILDEYVYKKGFSGQQTFKTEIIVVDAAGKTDSFSSLSEAKAVKSYISKNNPVNYAVLAPYRKQVSLLKEKQESKDDNILTIHTSQGREWDDVIISVTDTHPFGFTDSTKALGRCVLNTAISRARKRIIIVCNKEKWLRFKDTQLIGKLVASATTNIEGATK